MTEKKEIKEDDMRGISMQKTNFIMAAITVIVSVFLLVAAFRTSEGYRLMHDAADRYIDEQQRAFDLQIGSDYLTEQVRCFTVTGERAYLDNYFEEAKVTRRRDHALEALETIADSEAHRSLNAAMNASVLLMNREYYAMRLTAEAYGYDLSTLPEEVRSVQISETTKALPPEKKAEMARAAVFDDAYHKQKETISANMQKCVSELGRMTEDDLDSASEQLRLLLARVKWLIFILIIAVLAIVLLTFLLVISPLLRAVIKVRADQPLPVRGSNEFRFLARTYNLMYEANRESKEQLAYEATHDQLTGLYNRSGFEFLMRNVDFGNSAFLLFDLDKFKAVNDSYGHEVGDRALKRVAKTVHASFRTGDYICRIGGDEFAAIMVGAGQDNAGLIEKKINAINRKLNEPEDDLPAISISVGVAFGGEGLEFREIYRNADSMLYRVKSAGGCGCAFYGVEPEAEGEDQGGEE